MAGKKIQSGYCWQARYRKLMIYFASSVKGAMMVGITLSDSAEDCIGYFGRLFPGTRLLKDPGMNVALIDAVLAALENRKSPKEIPLDVGYTPFQMAVWNAIAKIPYGTTKTYSEVGRLVGKPFAARAVGQAMGQNPLPLYFP